MDDFKLLMLMSLAVIPLVLLLRKPKAAPAIDHSAVME
jgi:DHA2 family multidrug resistance protein